MRLIVQVLPLLPENSRGAFLPPHLAAFKPRKFALPVEPGHTFEQVWKSIEERYKRNYLTPGQASSFIIKKLQDAYDCDLDLGDTVASIFEGESDQEKRMIKVVPGYIDRDFSVPVTSNLRPAYAQKRIREINELNSNKRPRVDGPHQLSFIPEGSPDKPLPSTESEGSDDNGMPDEQPRRGDGGGQQRSVSKESVIYVKNTQLEGGDVVEPEVVKRESPELGLPMMRTIPESDDESESRPLTSQENPPTQKERPFLKPALPASIISKRESQEIQKGGDGIEDTRSGATESVDTDLAPPDEAMDDLSDNSPALPSSPQPDTSQPEIVAGEPKAVVARQNVYDVFDSPERDIRPKAARKLTTYGRFPRTPKLVQSTLRRSRSSSAKSASSRSERSVSARKNLFKQQLNDEIVSTPKHNDRSSFIRGESPMYASKLLGLVRETSATRRGSTNLQNMTTASPEGAEIDMHDSSTTPKVSPAQKPSSLKRPSRTSYQIPKPVTGSNGVNGGRATVDNSFKTPSKPAKRPHPFSSQKNLSSAEGESTVFNSRTLDTPGKQSGSARSVLSKATSGEGGTPSIAKTVIGRRSSTETLAKANSSSPQSSALSKIEALKRNIERRRSMAPEGSQRGRSDSTQTVNDHTPSSQVRQAPMDRSLEHPEQSSVATLDVLDKSEKDLTRAEEPVNSTPLVTHEQENQPNMPTPSESAEDTTPATESERSASDSLKLVSSKVQNSIETVSHPDKENASDLRQQLVVASVNDAPLERVRSASDRPRSTPVRSAVPLPENVRALSSQIHPETATESAGKTGKRVVSTTNSIRKETPVPVPTEKSTKRRRRGKDDSPEPATRPDENTLIENSDVRATPPAKRRRTGAQGQKMVATMSETLQPSRSISGTAISPELLQTILRPGKVKKEPKPTPSPPAVQKSSEKAVIELSSNSSDASSASSDIPFEGDLSLFPSEAEVQRSLQADSQKDESTQQDISSRELERQPVKTTRRRTERNGVPNKTRGGFDGSTDLAFLPDADSTSPNDDSGEKVDDQATNGAVAHSGLAATKDHALGDATEEETPVAASPDANGSIADVPSGQGDYVSESDEEVETAAPLRNGVELEEEEQETARKPARYLSRSPTPRSGSESPSSNDDASEAPPGELTNGVTVNGDHNNDDGNTSSSSSSDSSSDDDSDAGQDFEMPDAHPPASSPPTYAGQAKTRLAKQNAKMSSSQPMTSQSISSIPTPSKAPTHAANPRTRTSMTPAAANSRGRKSMTPGLVKASDITRPRRPQPKSFPSLSQQVQDIRRSTQASSPPKKFDPTAQSFSSLKSKQTVKGKKNSKVFEVSDSSTEESSSESSGDEVFAKKKGKGGSKPGCSVV